LILGNAVIERTESIVKLSCPDCGRKDLRRLPRHGFWQRQVLFWFGYFPWECPLCRRTRFFRDRGRSRKKAALHRGVERRPGVEGA